MTKAKRKSGDKHDDNTSVKDVPVLDPNNDANKMSMFSGMCMVVGLMIGSGIFSTPSKILGYCGSPGMALIIWSLGGLVTFAGT